MGCFGLLVLDVIHRGMFFIADDPEQVCVVLKARFENDLCIISMERSNFGAKLKSSGWYMYSQSVRTYM